MATRPSTSRRRRKPPISHMMLITAAQGNLTQTCPAIRGEPRAPLPGAADGVLDGGRGRRPTQPADAYTAIIASSSGQQGYVQPMRPVAAYLRSLDPRLPRPVYVLELGALVNAFGNGVALPFLLIYLHNVRGISFGLAGSAAAVQSGRPSRPSSLG